MFFGILNLEMKLSHMGPLILLAMLLHNFLVSKCDPYDDRFCANQTPSKVSTGSDPLISNTDMPLAARGQPSKEGAHVRDKLKCQLKQKGMTRLVQSKIWRNNFGHVFLQIN